MRDAMKRMGGDPKKINPLQPVELVIDHSVQVDEAGHRRRLPHQRRAGIQPQPGALRLPPLGPGRLQELPGRPARHRASSTRSTSNTSPGSSSLGRRGRQAAHRRPTGLSRHARRHRLAHDDDQRPGRPRLGRRRDRGRGGDARPAGLDARPAGRRLQAPRRAARRGDGDRPRADRHPDAPPQGRRRQVRRVLRRRPGEPAAGRPRHDRQHGPRVRRDLRHLPGRRRDAPLPRALAAGPRA